ncbi:MAG: 1-acyl-sn-glycerol-3-phosphate acyltransferase [Porticoccaceae bacterium]|nr:1-acyl-sn-glycerol-3-phosphate acyltransferase [Porticoccaceae bacterium]MDG1311402.1 1-acyl-sn-glycerol-3-phosphate acyltransferase [Porticoccaceae bacterium]
MTEFDDIRPYNDSEVPVVIARLLADPEFLNLLLSRKLPVLSKLPLLNFFARPFLRNSLSKLAAGVRTVEDFQSHMSTALVNVLERTTDDYSFTGLENLDANKAYLFMSNHRDIALDPAMINLALILEKLQTLRIAIGDNLLRKPYASDLMRVNRSFIVKRSVTGRRDKLEALKTLSRYIRYSIVEEKVSCWIAQAEGRAKNGRDRTETALLKMLALSKAEGQSFGAAIQDINLIPVSISYEYDPCAGDKARELHAAQQGLTYVKNEFEDLDSILKGLVEYKGRIQVNFGQPISAEYEIADQLAAEIDRQILSNYKLFPTNILAWQMQGDKDSAALAALKQRWPREDWLETEVRFKSHLAAIPSMHRQIVIDAYATPVDNQLSLQNKS